MRCRASRSLARGVIAALGLGGIADGVARGQEPVVEMHLFVAREGSDAEGDGSADQPFRSLSRALALLAEVPGRRTEIHLGIGHYGKQAGEAFPLRLPAGVRVIGYGSRACEIVGVPEEPILLLPATGALAVEGVELRGGSVGLLATATATAGTESSGSRLDLTLADCVVRGCAVAVDLRPVRGSAVVRATGLRLMEGDHAIDLAGEGAIELDLRESVIRRFVDGIHAASAVAAVAAEGEAPRPSHQIQCRSCRFEENSGAAVRRRGPGAGGPVIPWTFDECLFVGNGVGIGLEIPGGDHPLVVRRCQFLENVHHGISAVGSGTALEPPSRIEESLFRWNGIGLHFLAMGRRADLVGCRIEESLGNGIFLGNFTGAKSRAALDSCLLARNGGTGFFALSEVPEGVEVTLVRCTLADNLGAAVERKNRKKGSGPISLERCVVGGNGAAGGKELERIEAHEVRGSLIESGLFGAENGNAGGPAGFVDRARRDWRLRADSPGRAMQAGVPDAAAPARKQ